MKLTDLITELYAVILEKGNLDVYTLHGDPGLPGKPKIRMDEDSFETKYYPGVYLN